MEFYRAHVLVCAGTGCTASDSQATREALIQELANRGLDREIKVIETGCFGFCRFGPNMMVYPEGVFYCTVRPEDIPELVEEHFIKGRVLERLLYKQPETEVPVSSFEEIPFFKHQLRIALRNCGVINPESIEEYIARDGYLALAKVLTEMKPIEVIEVIKKSGLRGRGGGGFPTGLKWEFAYRAPGPVKYIICNADEGDPGAFMDRSILEGDPHAVLEGMAIAGYAIGANQGYVYVRAEYPIAVQRLKIAISQAREKGLLGKNLFNSGFDFDIDIRLGAGAFVCGEETALIASIEGRRGEPRPRPPFPAISGLWGKPTVINNVETFANIPTIIRNGWEWFASIGTEKSKGTKVFALAGKIKNNGLVEVPMGTTLGTVIYDIGGGIPGGKKFKAAQTGGPSGGCIPAEHLNVPIDYESLTALGTIMGSGGLIVLDEDTCMVDLAKFFLDFVKDESCGKCTPCRIGTTRMLEILDRITKGQGQEGDIELLIELGQRIKDTALCGLGQTAPNPVLSTIRYFREEYEAHIRDKRCPASVCAALFNSPCQNTCPANVDVPVYIDLIRQRKFLEAYEVIKYENPFPVVCGRVCHHPCEGKCNRAKMDEAVAIRSLKRFAGDFALSLNGKLPKLEVAPTNGKKVAIVGSGPAGLTAAHYLALKGYQVTVFEALPVAGGMMAVGIPEYRLPKEILMAEIKNITELGVEIRTNSALGRDFTLEDLRRDGYQAIFLAIGTHRELKLDIPGEELEGVYSGVSFLRELNLGRPVDVKDKVVAVIGGGNVAVDAARSARRLGAREVYILYRRTQEDMPAIREEIHEAEKEGIHITCLTAPVAILGEKGRVKAIRCQKMRPGEFDKSGRRKPVPVEGSEFTMDVDVVIAAVGQTVDREGLPADIEVTRAGTIAVNEKTLATNLPGVFAGGDCVSGPDTVITAIASGKKAAAAIDKYLGGDGVVVPEYKVERKRTAPVLEEKTARVCSGLLPVEKRLDSFAEVELGFTEEQAVMEAARCLRCDVRD
ncbi:NADH-quinone oxidoreductase subunit F [Thermanaeromonas toyohensis ToBE]|uniref:NADH-quinone oxidoreductase subunit F n=1 Tax=Thermanaeromonas toyohensis ToBE TaxID=698762 RepID=A0A1W1VZZ6_9FIRM|nr:NADH-quinone oxidoreductase subunit NuoF [Thermanaeromonas toyohensis]SMB98918.1 NADH-quinone oxidoreductase subunit F [Thermanaeromonas toyohensis ToBE]